MGAIKLSYNKEQEALVKFEKTLKVVHTKRAFSEKKGLNYYTFGSLMPGRHTVQTSSEFDQNGNKVYKYGFNGKESDFEMHNNGGTSYDYGFRMYDARIGRFPSADPLIIKGKQYPELTPYQYASLNPIWFIDLDGLEGTENQLKGTGKAALTTGKIGVGLTLFGFEFEISYTFDGSASQEINTEASLGPFLKQDLKVQHKQSNVEEGGFTFKIGIIGGGEEQKVKETTNTVSIGEGFVQKEETVIIPDQGSVGPITTDNKGTSISFDFGLKLNFLIVGVEAGAGVELTDKKQ